MYFDVFFCFCFSVLLWPSACYNYIKTFILFQNEKFYNETKKNHPGS